jgi:hypothetical protein
MKVDSLDGDGRSVVINVAGPAALLVAKMHKLGERIHTPGRLNDKDAHDSYRLLAATSTSGMATTMRLLLDEEIARDTTRQSLDYLRELFADGPNALGSMMAGRAEEGVGDPANVSASVAFLAKDVLDAL